MAIKAVKLLLVLLLLTVWFAPPHPVTSARDPQCTSGWCEDTFEAGGKVHDIGYPETLLTESLAAREAVTQSINTLQPIFSGNTSVPFQVTITVTPTEAPNWATASPGTVVIPETDGLSTVAVEALQCHIIVNSLPNPSIWLFILAHEMAHCYQYQYVDNFAYNPPDDNWWVDGAAEWLASLVYPDLADAEYTQGGRKQAFASTYFTPLFQKWYEAVYFWQFLEAELGYQAAVSLMRNMPPALAASDYIDYLRSAIPDLDDVFQHYATALYSDSVPYQPPYNSMSHTVTMASALPLSEPIGADLLAIDYRTYGGISLPPDKALRVVVTGTEPAQMRATLLMGSTIHWLQDGQPADLCSPPDTFTVALSRTGTLNAEINAGIELMEIDAESATCLAKETVLPDCIVGRWNITELPEIPGAGEVTMMWEPNNYYLEFRADGTFDGVVKNLVAISEAQGMQMEATLNAVLHGVLTVEPNAVAIDQYDVVEYDSALKSGSMIATVNGVTQDLTDVFLGGGSEGVLPPVRSLTCIDATHLQYTATVGGMELTWNAERAP